MVKLGYIPQGALIEYDKQVVERIAPREVPIDRMLGGEAKYGKLHLREDRIDLLEQWLEPKPISEYVRAQKSEGIIIPVEGKHHPANIAGVTLTESIARLNMRDVGKYLSLHENFRQHMINYMKSDEGQALAKHLNQLGYTAEDIKYIAIGFVPNKAIYAIGRLHNRKVVILANKDSYRMIERGAHASGNDISDLREAGIAEEFAHNFRSSYDKAGILEEEATKEMLKEFYKTLAGITRDSKLKAKYSRVIRHLEHDIETISRYAKVNSSLQELVELYCADVGELEQILEAKAIYEGINTNEGILKYVSEKLGKIAEAARKEYSGDNKNGGDKGNAEKGGNKHLGDKSFTKSAKGATESANANDTNDAEGEASNCNESAESGGEMCETAESGGDGEGGEGGGGGDGGGE